MKSGSGNSSKKEKNAINWHVNNSKSSWFSWSWRYDWKWSLKKRMQENRN